MTTVEAMACGTPVVAADRGGLGKVARGHALLVGVPSAEALGSHHDIDACSTNGRVPCRQGRFEGEHVASTTDIQASIRLPGGGWPMTASEALPSGPDGIVAPSRAPKISAQLAPSPTHVECQQQRSAHDEPCA